VTVDKQHIAEPQYSGASPIAPTDKIPQHMMRIDGDAATVMRRFSSLADIDHLRYDVSNIAYHLRPRKSALVIGVGGGKDIQSAILFGYERIVGVEINPVFIDLLVNEFRDFAGIADRSEVRLVNEEARSYLSRTEEKFSVIQMSLIDTWAATGAGAFSLSENGLYTMEAWTIFMNRLSDDGIFTISRWHSPANPGETGRAVSLAVATLLQMGVEEPAAHIALISADRISALLVSKQPLTISDIQDLKKTSKKLRFTPVILPGERPTHPMLRAIVEAKTLKALRASVALEALNYKPPTDNSPYFFNMLRWNKLGGTFTRKEGVIQGNITATRT